MCHYGKYELVPNLLEERMVGIGGVDHSVVPRLATVECDVSFLGGNTTSIVQIGFRCCARIHVGTDNGTKHVFGAGNNGSTLFFALTGKIVVGHTVQTDVATGC